MIQLDAQSKLGLCRCGCGIPTHVPKRNMVGKYVKGVPVDFVRGHHVRKKNDHALWSIGKMSDGQGYIMVKCPGHPKVKWSNFVYEHVLVMERHLGRYLNDGEVVHHNDGDITNNKISNLRLFPSQAEHTRYHASQRRLAATKTNHA
jgi:hypothetical protein